jgi:flagellar biosynthesis protein FlhB
MSESSGEKTEQPSDKRLRDAKKKGQVAKSQDLSSAVLLIAAVAVIWGTSGLIGDFTKEFLKTQLIFAPEFKGEFTLKIANDLFIEGIKVISLTLATLFGVCLILAFAINYLQIGSIFSVESLSPKFSKINPTEAFKNKFLKAKAYIELVKTIFKIVITAVLVGSILWSSRQDIFNLITYSPEVSVSFLMNLFINIGLKVGIAFVLIGGADFMLQKFLHRKELRMTKKEVKDEYKEMEGDPYIKSKRRQIHREIIAQSMANAVRKADVVVANPTHVAIAISYNRGEMDAPRIVAKGADFMAAQMREIATEANVPIMRDIPLARTLYELDIEDEIPENLYESVAVVLRWVYELNENKNN